VEKVVSNTKKNLFVFCLSISLIVIAGDLRFADVILPTEVFGKNANDSVEWSMTYGGSRHDFANALIQTQDGGFALAGYTLSFGLGSRDMWLVKTSTNGLPEWNNTFGGSESEIANDLIQTQDGGFVLAGYTTSYGAGESDMWLVKTYRNGTKQWTQTYGGRDWDQANDVIMTSDGGYLLAGYTNGGLKRMRLVKTDNNGIEKWSQTYDNFREANAVLETTDGSYILAVGSMDLVKIHSNGTEQWSQSYGTYCGVYDVIETTDGGLLLAGYTDSHRNNQEVFLVKTDSNGNKQWNQTYGGENFDYANAVIETTDGGYLLAGHTGEFYSDFLLVKTDSTGNEQWIRTFGGPLEERATSLLESTAGEFLIGGFTTSFGIDGSSDMWLVKIVHQLSIPVIVYPIGGETVHGIITIQWSTSTDSWAHQPTY
jgi:hypothetical protein